MSRSFVPIMSATGLPSPRRSPPADKSVAGLRTYHNCPNQRRSVRDHSAKAVEDRALLLFLRLVALARLVAVGGFAAHHRVHVLAEQAHIGRLDAQLDRPVRMPGSGRPGRADGMAEIGLAPEGGQSEDRPLPRMGDLGGDGAAV